MPAEPLTSVFSVELRALIAARFPLRKTAWVWRGAGMSRSGLQAATTEPV